MDIYDRLMALHAFSMFEPCYKKHKEGLLYLLFEGLNFLISIVSYGVLSEIFCMGVWFDKMNFALDCMGEKNMDRGKEKCMDKERFFWLDLARSSAILLVILNHAVELTYPLTLEGWHECIMVLNIVKVVSFSAGRLGVPLFLCISGALLLNKTFQNKEDILRFYRHNLLTLLLTVEIWNVIYFIFNALFYQYFNVKELVKAVLFCNSCMKNMWYMPMILGMYLAVPFLTVIIQQFPLAVTVIPFAVVFYSSVLLPSINLALGDSISCLIDVSFLGGCYGCYLVSGFYINKKVLGRVPLWLVIILAMAGFGMTVLIQVFNYQKGNVYNVWYDFFGNYLSGVLLFEIFRRYKEKEGVVYRKIARYLSKISLGLFFVHMPVQLVIAKYFKGWGTIKFILLWIGTVVAGTVIIFVGCKNEKIKKYILMIKS